MAMTPRAPSGVKVSTLRRRAVDPPPAGDSVRGCTTASRSRNCSRSRTRRIGRGASSSIRADSSCPSRKRSSASVAQKLTSSSNCSGRVQTVALVSSASAKPVVLSAANCRTSSVCDRALAFQWISRCESPGA